MKKVILACGMGVATSTIVMNRMKEAMAKRGLDGAYTVLQCKVAEVPSKAAGHDLIVATTRIPDLGIPFVNGVPLLTGVGAEKVWDEIAEVIRK